MSEDEQPPLRQLDVSLLLRTGTSHASSGHARGRSSVGTSILHRQPSTIPPCKTLASSIGS